METRDIYGFMNNFLNKLVMKWSAKHKPFLCLIAVRKIKNNTKKIFKRQRDILKALTASKGFKHRQRHCQA